MSELPWYKDGLRFACTRCGHCCTGEPGAVRVTDDEVERLARHVGLDLADFSERYTRRLPDGTTSLSEKLNFECVFWSGEQGCTVYSARPKQCRTWPFWQRNVASGEHWRAAARGCPGIGQGPLFELSTIARTAADDGTSGDVPRAEEL